MSRRIKWAQQRAQGYGPALQRNTISAENPQAPMFAPLPSTVVAHIERVAVDAVVKAAAEEAIADPNACPKCGRVIGRGRATHIKFCKGMSVG